MRRGLAFLGLAALLGFGFYRLGAQKADLEARVARAKSEVVAIVERMESTAARAASDVDVLSFEHSPAAGDSWRGFTAVELDSAGRIMDPRPTVFRQTTTAGRVGSIRGS